MLEQAELSAALVPNVAVRADAELSAGREVVPQREDPVPRSASVVGHSRVAWRSATRESSSSVRWVPWTGHQVWSIAAASVSTSSGRRPASRQSRTSLGCSARWTWIGGVAVRGCRLDRGGDRRLRHRADRVRQGRARRRFGSSAKAASRSAVSRRQPSGSSANRAARPRAAAVDPGLHVHDRQQGQRDAGLLGRPVRAPETWSPARRMPAVGLMVQVMELDDRGVAALEQLDIELGRDRPLVLGRDVLREPVHRVAPGPEAGRVRAEPLGQAGQRALEGVAVQVDHAGQTMPPIRSASRRRRRWRPRRCCRAARPRSARSRPSRAAGAPCRRDRFASGPPCAPGVQGGEKPGMRQPGPGEAEPMDDELPAADLGRDPRHGRPPRRPRRPYAGARLGWAGDPRPGWRRDPGQPQARAVPAHRLVQGARRVGGDAGLAGGGAGARGHGGERRQPCHRHRLGGARAGHPRQGRHVRHCQPAAGRRCALRRRGGAGPDIAEAFETAKRIGAEEGRAFVHLRGPRTALGTATVGLEWLEQAPNLDAVVIPVGGGGLLAGIACAVKQLRPDCLVFGVEPVGADSMWRSFAAGSPQRVERSRPSPTASAPPTRCPTASACAAASRTRSCDSRMRHGRRDALAFDGAEAGPGARRCRRHRRLLGHCASVSPAGGSACWCAARTSTSRASCAWAAGVGGLLGGHDEAWTRAGAADRPGCRPRAGRSRHPQRADPEHRDRHLDPGRHRDLRRYDRRHPRRLPRPARDRRQRPRRGAGLHRHHVHIESSLVLPAEFEQGVLPRGTTTAICDPHEIANVLGVAGIRYFLEASESLAMTLRVNLSSCVPATDLETAGARLEVADLLPLRAHPRPWAGRGDELPGRARQGPRPPGQARGVRRRPRRRPRAAPARPARSTAISRPASAPTTSARPRGGPREAPPRA